MTSSAARKAVRPPRPSEGRGGTGLVPSSVEPSSRCRSPLGAQPPGEPGATPGLPEPPEPLDQHRVVLERFRPVDQPVEQVIIPSKGDAESLADTEPRGDRSTLSLALELEDVLPGELERSRSGHPFPKMSWPDDDRTTACRRDATRVARSRPSRRPALR